MPASRLSAGDLLLLIAAIAAFGIAVSGYLAWQWYEGASASWCDVDAFFSCTRVRESVYAAVAGVPTAWVGVAGFGILLALALAGLRGVDRLGPWSVPRLLLAFAGVGGAIGGALTYVEFFVIEAVCILCVIAFVLDLGVMGLGLALRRAGPAGA